MIETYIDFLFELKIMWIFEMHQNWKVSHAKTWFFNLDLFGHDF